MNFYAVVVSRNFYTANRSYSFVYAQLVKLRISERSIVVGYRKYADAIYSRLRNYLGGTH